MMNVYFRDDVSVRRIVYGTWGGVASDITTVYKGRFVFETKMVRNVQGEMVVSSAYVMLPIMALEHKDKIIYDSKEYSILGIEKKKDFSERYLLVNLA
ncbi:hypothetical protein FJZ33_00145 [Candidatus Poribacteria bacterium]|nr:hypothetical protein [Candidatus Poribacteria bacterium]